MNRRQLTTIERQIRATLTAEQRVQARVHGPKGVTSDEYNAAWSAARQAQQTARYVAEYYIGSAEQRATFLSACGLSGRLN